MIACRFVPVPEARTATLKPLISGCVLRFASGLAGSTGYWDDRQLFERELPVRALVVAERVLAREAGVAVLLARRSNGLIDALDRKVGERVRAHRGRDLLDAATVGDHLLARRHVDAVVAGMANRR